MPRKATCSCPVGLNGVYCHILALFLYLKHYSNTKEEILELTCTQQLQNMVSLNEIKAKSASMKKRK